MNYNNKIYETNLITMPGTPFKQIGLDSIKDLREIAEMLGKPLLRTRSTLFYNERSYCVFVVDTNIIYCIRINETEME